MKIKPPLLALALCAVIHAEDGEKPPEYLAAPSREFPTRVWKASEKEAESWKGPFAPALRTLLAAGFPDPSDLAYRRIGITTGNCYTGNDGITETEGWLLPAKDGEPSFAIAWNGLIYPVARDMGEAKLKERVANIMKVGEKERASWFDTGEATQVTPSSLSLIHGLYLTRLGYTEAADYVLKNRAAPLKSPPLEGDLAIEWVWNLYERAVSAHMRGDPTMALASMTSCKQAIAALEKTLKDIDPMFGSVKSWQDDIVVLEKECERRLKSGKTGLFEERAFAAGSHDVLELIDALDRIAIPQDGQPGDVPLWDSAVVKALVAKGDSAVEPLIDCLEKDTRLTQSVHYWRSHHKSRTILGVQEAAIYALQSLLSTDYFTLVSTGDSLTERDPDYRKKLAAKVRANWEKYGRTSGPERAFHILQDDGAGIDAWMQAGGSLLHTTEYDEETGEAIPPKGPLPGEPLRAEHDPSASDLLEKRAAEAGKQANAGDSSAGHGRIALLSILLDWDPPRGRAAIAALAKRWLVDRAWASEKRSILLPFLQEVSDKVPETLPVIEEIMWTLASYNYEGWSHRSSFVTTMYLKHEGQLKRKDLWTNPESPWHLTQLKSGKLEDLIDCWKEHELLDKEPFHHLVAALLNDDSKCGEVYINRDDPKTWQNRDGSGGYRIPDNAKLGLKPGESLPLRRKDVTGRALKKARFVGDKLQEPILEYYWSLEDRDRWLSKVAAEFNAPKKEPAAGDKTGVSPR